MRIHGCPKIYEHLIAFYKKEYGHDTEKNIRKKHTQTFQQKKPFKTP